MVGGGRFKPARPHIAAFHIKNNLPASRTEQAFGDEPNAMEAQQVVRAFSIAKSDIGHAVLHPLREHIGATENPASAFGRNHIPARQLAQHRRHRLVNHSVHRTQAQNPAPRQEEMRGGAARRAATA